MHQGTGDAQQPDQGRSTDPSELSDAELEDAAGGVVINHEEQYSFKAKDLAVPEIPDPVAPDKMKLGDVLKKERE